MLYPKFMYQIELVSIFNRVLPWLCVDEIVYGFVVGRRHLSVSTAHMSRARADANVS